MEIILRKREKQKIKEKNIKTHIEYFSKPILHIYLCKNVFYGKYNFVN